VIGKEKVRKGKLGKRGNREEGEKRKARGKRRQVDQGTKEGEWALTEKEAGLEKRDGE